MSKSEKKPSRSLCEEIKRDAAALNQLNQWQPNFLH